MSNSAIKCPHCQKIFINNDNITCPFCGKNLMNSPWINDIFGDIFGNQNNPFYNPGDFNKERE